MARLILVINPGSASTKLALFEDEACLVSESIDHDPADLAAYPRISDQFPMRLAAVRAWLQVQLDQLTMRGSVAQLDAIAARGGLLRPLPSGTYAIDHAMVADLRRPDTPEHASNLAAPMALELALEYGGAGSTQEFGISGVGDPPRPGTRLVPAFCVDPVSMDELEDVARVSGLPELQRKSWSHALSLKAAARRAARELGRRYEKLDLVVVHMGSGISVSAHRHGRMVDVNNANDQGPFSPERVGTVPLTGLLKMCTTEPADTLRRRFWREGGLAAHLGTNDAREVERRIAEGDERALLVYRAMAYQVAKEIGAMATVLGRAPDAVVVTGGLAHSRLLIQWIEETVSFLGRFVVYPGSDEMLALASGVLRVLREEEQTRRYEAAST